MLIVKIRLNIEHITSFFATLFFAVSYGYLEWRFVALERGTPVVLGFADYHLFPMLPIFLVVSYSALLDNMLHAVKGEPHLFLRPILVGSGHMVLSVVVEDAAYFLWGGIWITPQNWTARWGYVTIAGAVIPYWYILSVALALALYILAAEVEALKGLMGVGLKS